MWSKIFETAKELIALNHDINQLKNDVRQNREDISQLERELRAMSEKVTMLAAELRIVRENERHEREKLVLQLQNTLLQFERRLPPAKDNQGS